METEEAQPARGEKPVRKLTVKAAPSAAMVRPKVESAKEAAPVVPQAADKPESIDIAPDGKIFNEQTAAITQPVAEETKAPPAAEPEEAFNAKTMAMDPVQLDAEMEKEDERPRTVRIPSKEAVANLDKTMDMSEQRPKTIMIKRPGK